MLYSWKRVDQIARPYEKSGELFGLMRVRSMQMNDAHIYCTEDQFKEEFIGVCKLYMEYFKIFGAICNKSCFSLSFL